MQAYFQPGHDSAQGKAVCRAGDRPGYKPLSLAAMTPEPQHHVAPLAWWNPGGGIFQEQMMGKRKWRRGRLVEMATQEEQDRILNLISQVSSEESQAQDPRKRPGEMDQVEG